MGDAPNYAVLALPIFAAAVFMETLIARRRGRLKELYAFGTSVSDIGCGAAFQAMEVLLNLGTLAVYAWLFDNFRLVSWEPQSPWPWVIGLFGVDFLYYWWHRISHVSNLMWAVHGVHHQSEDYNLAVALRQPILEPVTWLLFYWVLAFAGVPPLVYVISYGLNLFYQFWIHTELVGRLPRPVEWLLNTPSHHRVHHGIDAAYLDRNYAGILVLWDRLFGSFEPEQQRPTYGTTVPLRSYNPLWGNLAHLHRTWALCRLARRPLDKLWVWFAHPAWLPGGVQDPEAKPDRRRYRKYRPQVPAAVRRYVGLNMVLVILLAVPFVFIGHSLPLVQVAAAAFALVLSHAVLGGMVEGRDWATSLEGLRILVLAATTGWVLGSNGDLWTGLIAAGAVLGLALMSRWGLAPRSSTVVVEPTAPDRALPRARASTEAPHSAHERA